LVESFRAVAGETNAETFSIVSLNIGLKAQFCNEMLP